MQEDCTENCREKKASEIQKFITLNRFLKELN